MESKFFDQDVDVVSFASKCIVIGCFVGRNYDKILIETGKLTDKIRVTKTGFGYGVDRIFQSSDSAFNHFTDRLNPFGKSVEFDILFLGPLSDIRFTCIHDNIKVLVPWKWDRFPEFWAFETVLFLWKCNIFDGRNVILKVGQCWLFYTCCICHMHGCVFCADTEKFGNRQCSCRTCNSAGITKLELGRDFGRFIFFSTSFHILSLTIRLEFNEKNGAIGPQFKKLRYFYLCVLTDTSSPENHFVLSEKLPFWENRPQSSAPYILTFFSR